MSSKNIQDEKWYVVEYAGFHNLTNKPNYKGEDILDASNVGQEKAKANAKLAAAAPEMLRVLLEIQPFFEGKEYKYTKMIDKAIRNATT